MLCGSCNYMALIAGISLQIEDVLELLVYIVRIVQDKISCKRI